MNSSENFSAGELIERIDTDLLPAGFLQLADVMGLEAAVRFVRAFPGVRIYVPARIHMHHQFVDIVGQEAAEALAKSFPGDYIKVPNITALERQIKDQELSRMKAEGLSNRDCALYLGLTERTIERKLSERRAEQQLDMFGGNHAATA
jgi:hypothetical protein